MSNISIQIPDNLDASQLLKFLKHSADSYNETPQHELELHFGQQIFVLDHKQQHDIRFIKTMLMSMIIMSLPIDFNEFTTKDL